MTKLDEDSSSEYFKCRYTIQGRMKRLQARHDRIEQRFETIEHRLSVLEIRFVIIENDLVQQRLDCLFLAEHIEAISRATTWLRKRSGALN